MDEAIAQLSCSYEPGDVEIRGTRMGIRNFSKIILANEAVQVIRLSSSAISHSFANGILRVELVCTQMALKIRADGDVLQINGGRESFAMFAHSIRNLSNSDKCDITNHMHFEPGADECISEDSWPVTVELL